jgi:hypothetical protein
LHPIRINFSSCKTPRCHPERRAVYAAKDLNRSVGQDHMSEKPLQ